MFWAKTGAGVTGESLREHSERTEVIVLHEASLAPGVGVGNLFACIDGIVDMELYQS